MNNQESFKIGDEIQEKIYDYDEYNIEHINNIKGKVYQVTKDFVVIDNGKYKECFKYSQFNPKDKEEYRGSYDQQVEDYHNDIVNECIENINNTGEGYVFSLEQLREVMASDKIKSDYKLANKNGIFYIFK